MDSNLTHPEDFGSYHDDLCPAFHEKAGNLEDVDKCTCLVATARAMWAAIRDIADNIDPDESYAGKRAVDIYLSLKNAERNS